MIIFSAEKKNLKKSMNLRNSINPINKDGSTDHRYTSIANQIIDIAGQECAHDLTELYEQTKQNESKYELAGLRLVSAFFQVEMERWQRNAFKKRLRDCLAEIGFRPSKVTRLIKAGEFVATEMLKNKQMLKEGPDDFWPMSDGLSWEEEKQDRYNSQIKFLRDHGLTGLYELARMNDKGLIKALIGYRENGEIPLSTRELEKLQKRHPAKTFERRGRPATFRGSKEKEVKIIQAELDEVRGFTSIDISAQDVSELSQLEPAEDSGEVSNAELVEQFAVLAQAIDWSTIGCDKAARGFLTSIEETLSFIADLAHESRYSPVM